VEAGPVAARRRHTWRVALVLSVAAATWVLWSGLLLPTVAAADSYDLRDYGLVTPVRDQGELGCCWAFAACGSLESSLLIGRLAPGATHGAADLSEWHLATRNGQNTPDYIYPYDSPGGWGASLDDAAAYFARGQGPVLERDAPYPLADIQAHNDLTPPAEYLPTLYMLRSAGELDRADYAGDAAYRAAVKSAVRTRGALATHMYIESNWSASPYYDATNMAWRYDGGTGTNHGVTVVGWDDAQPVAVGGATTYGAWQVKNSWGTGFANDGYIWVSYHDTAAVKRATAFEAGSGCFHGTLYEHQTGPPTHSTGYQPGVESHAASVFAASEADDLKSVSFYTENDGETVTLRVYRGWDDANSRPDQSELALTMSDVTCGQAGYHVVDLSSELAMAAGEEFVVSLAFDAYADYPIRYEHDASAAYGRTYYTWNESGTWYDFASSSGIFALKAIMADEPAAGDVNGDESVGKTDFDLIAANWEPFAAGNEWYHGDLDGDGAIGNSDFAIVLGGWTAAPASAGHAPEPTSLSVLALAAAALLARRRRRKKGSGTFLAAAMSHSAPRHKPH
jgi:C1A family cysteine protease